MTRLDPNLRLSRLVAVKSGAAVYDEEFHAGVNIIRGEGNSVGKSSIADLIFFALGGDLTSWKAEAGSCDVVLAEIVVNGALLTLRREITSSIQQPMWIFFGGYEEASSASTEGWQRYLYGRQAERDSFSQVLFRQMGMPEVPSEPGVNLTMHQLLRLMYVDQLTPVDRIFRFETRDLPWRRQAVGDLLCGVYDARIYPAQLLLRDKAVAYEAANRELLSLFDVLGSKGEPLTVEYVQGKRVVAEQRRAETLKHIEELKQSRFQSPKDATDGLLSDLQADLEKLNLAVAERQRRAVELAYAIEDAAELIRETERTLSQLREGAITQLALGPLEFLFCPSCLSPVDQGSGHEVCSLCKTETSTEATSSRLARMRNELEIQLKESIQLQEDRAAELKVAKVDAERAQAVRDRLASEYLSRTRHHLTDADTKIDELTARLGYIDRELEELDSQKQLALRLADLAEEKATLNQEITELKENIRSWSLQRDERQSQIFSNISRKTAELLSNDIKSEAEFAANSDVYFNFAEDRISVNGKTSFSASSLTMIRNAFHLALLWCSGEDARMRYPRFALMDNIEDKGMTQQRSQNFQRLVVALSEALPTEHQIIFTTSMIDPELDTSPYTVGDKYSFDHKSLRMHSI